MKLFAQPKSTIHSRWMIRRDMPEVLAIDKASTDYPWSEQEFLENLRQCNCVGKVAELDHSGDQIAGFIIYELERTKMVITRLAVFPFRRYGVGRHMVSELMRKLRPNRRSRLEIRIRESSLAAQLFMRSMGFRSSGVIREHFADSGEDAYVMAYVHEEARS